MKFLPRIVDWFLSFVFLDKKTREVRTARKEAAIVRKVFRRECLLSARWYANEIAQLHVRAIRAESFLHACLDAILLAHFLGPCAVVSGTGRNYSLPQALYALAKNGRKDLLDLLWKFIKTSDEDQAEKERLLEQLIGAFKNKFPDSSDWVDSMIFMEAIY
jgi:hypothetical protein